MQPSAPADAICISQAPAETQSFIYGFLASKGIMPEMVEDAEWSNEKQRILFCVGGAVLGRAVHARQQPKWVMYGQPIPFAAVGPAVAPGVAAGAPLKVVLTEDLLSALKIQHAVTSYSALNVQAIAMLGTRLPTQLRAWLIQNRPEVILMLDNDPAGHAGVAAARRALHAGDTAIGVENRCGSVEIHIFATLHRAGVDAHDVATHTHIGKIQAIHTQVEQCTTAKVGTLDALDVGHIPAQTGI